MQAILVKFLPATDTKGYRVSARCAAKRVTIAQADSLNPQGNARAAAKALLERLEWWHVEVSGIGQLPSGDWVVTLQEVKK